MRVAVWIHQFADGKRIKTDYGVLAPLKTDRMPARLAKLLPYQPVD